MICAKVKDAWDYLGICPGLDVALDHLTPEFLDALGDQQLELDDKRVSASRATYETLPLEDTFFEAHKRCLEVHLVLQGQERVDIARAEELDLFREEGDCRAYHGEAAQSIVLRPGEFLVLFPEDAHRVKIQADGPETVTKVLFKVHFRDQATS
jgi:YhcH/YjgK/YiaL family protein